jgi:hypothetical protein
MPLQAQSTSGVWELLEQLHLDSTARQVKANYATLTDKEKRAILKDFAKEQAVKSPRWANIAQNLLSAELAS